MKLIRASLHLVWLYRLRYEFQAYLHYGSLRLIISCLSLALEVRQFLFLLLHSLETSLLRDTIFATEQCRIVQRCKLDSIRWLKVRSVLQSLQTSRTSVFKMWGIPFLQVLITNTICKDKYNMNNALFKEIKSGIEHYVLNREPGWRSGEFDVCGRARD